MTPPADTIFVLSTASCQRCKVVAKHLDMRGIRYEYINVEQDRDWYDWMTSQGYRNVPLTVRGEEHVEGVDFDAINRLFAVPGRLPSAVRRLGMGMVQRSGWLKRFFMDEARGVSGDLPALLRA